MLELPLDPWQWPDLTAEEFRELLEMVPGMDPETPLFQYLAVRECNDLKPAINRGSGFAVLAAVQICGKHGLVMPEWLSYAFSRRYDAVVNCKAVSWDDPLSFGRPYPKGVNKNAQRKAKFLRFAVWRDINTIRKSEPGTPIDKGLFERVGRPLSIGATLAEEYYYSAKALVSEVGFLSPDHLFAPYFYTTKVLLGEMGTRLKLNGVTDPLLGPDIASDPQNTAKNPKSAGRRKRRR